MPENIFLTGFMGSGKSTVGALLARAMGRKFVDMDSELTRHFGQPIAEVFAQRGEAAFRQAESALLARLSRRRGLVAATGGGVAANPANRALMRADGGRIVWLRAGLEHCARRLGPLETAARPLWREAAAVERLFAQRQEAYADCDHAVDTEGLLPQQAAAAVLAAITPQRVFDAGLEGKRCPVTATFQAPAKLAELCAGRRVIVLSESRVAGLHLARLCAGLQPAAQVILPPGEATKTLAGARRVYDALLAANVERGDLLVAIGGGMITDLGAFVAATYKRGMDFILVSTSLLGCVDASVGGKAAVNLPAAKNIVGLFTTPLAVVLDLWALSTLPRAQRAEGLAEAYKTGLIGRPELFDLVDQRLEALLAGDLGGLAACAHLAAETKARVVSADFREKGPRRVLNLGHTYGHAVESWHNYKISHGRAVAVGMIVAARLSLERGLLAADLAQRVIDVCARLRGRPVALPPVEQAWPIMQNDKKNAGGKVVFVLLEGVGRPLVVDDLTPDELARALAALEAV